jgi:hypothetical protein
MNFPKLLFFLLTISVVSAQIKQQSSSDGKKTGLPASIQEYVLSFEGYDLKIYSDASDGLGNHVLTGTITELATVPGKKRDARILKALEASFASGPEEDIIITTDTKYTPVLITTSPGEGIARYDPARKKFLIGCNGYVAEMSNGELVTYYQPRLLIVNEKLEGRTYAVRSESSCTVLDFFSQDNLIHIFTKSKSKMETSINKYHITIQTVDTELSRPDANNPGKQVLEPISQATTPYDENTSLELAAPSKVGNAFYFVTSSISAKADDFSRTNRLYQFEALKLEEQDIPSPQLANTRSDWYYTNGFARTASDGYFFAVAQAIGPDVRLVRTDAQFNTTQSATITTVGFTDDDRAIALPSGAILLASGTRGEFWHYTIYNKQLKLVRTIASKIPGNYTLKLLVAGNSGTVKAIYYDFKKSDTKSVIVQDIAVPE